MYRRSRRGRCLGAEFEVEEALKAGADVNIIGSEGFTVLMLAALFNSPEVVSLLLKAGAYVNARNDKGETALTYAGDPEVISILDQYGAK